jgi:hypothetical protein
MERTPYVMVSVEQHQEDTNWGGKEEETILREYIWVKQTAAVLVPDLQ